VKLLGVGGEAVGLVLSPNPGSRSELAAVFGDNPVNPGANAQVLAEPGVCLICRFAGLSG